MTTICPSLIQFPCLQTRNRTSFLQLSLYTKLLLMQPALMLMFGQMQFLHLQTLTKQVMFTHSHRTRRLFFVTVSTLYLQPVSEMQQWHRS